MVTDTDALLKQISSAGGEFQTGGSLAATNGTYVPRNADVELIQNIKEGNFSFVLAPRQTGKSSMRVRVMDHLQDDDYVCSAVDITSIGSKNTTTEQWYYSYLYQICRGLGMTSNLKTWWKDHTDITPVLRVGRFFESVVLQEIQSEIVIFIDEIEAVLTIPKNIFNSDDFFGALRSYYNARVDNADFDRLNFVVLGVATPQDLMNDPKRTPFNIGFSIPLRNLELENAEPLNSGFEFLDVDKDELIAEVFKWTNGHPYLTQATCQSIARREVEINDIPQTVAENVRLLFLSEGSDDDSNISNVKNRLLGNAEQNTKMLGIYQKLHSGEGVLYDPDDETQKYLLLTGLVHEENGELKVDNRIYHEKFNQDWLSEILKKFDRPFAGDLNRWLNLPKAEKPSAALKGEVLRQAVLWAAERDDLSQLERDFINYSSRLEKKQERKKRIRLLLILILTGILAIAAVVAAILAYNNSILARAAEKDALFQKGEAEKSEKEALLQKGIAEENEQEALFQKGLAQENEAEALRQRELAQKNEAEALRQRALAQKNEKEALKQKGIAEANEELAEVRRQEAERLSRLAKSQSLAYRATQNHKNTQINGLLALESYFLNERNDNDANPRDPDIYEAMRSAIDRLDKNDNTIFRSPKDVVAFVFNDVNVLNVLDEDGKFREYDFENKKLLSGQTLSYKFPINKAFIFQELKIAVIGYENKKTFLWGIGEEKTEKIELDGPTGRLRAVAISPDNQTMVTGGRDQAIRIWNLKSIRSQPKVIPIGSSVRSLAFTSDGSKLISGDEKGRIILWNTSDYSAQKMDADSVRRRNISSEIITEGDRLAVGYSDGLIKLVNMSNLVVTQINEINEVGIEHIAINKDATLLAVASADATIKVYSVNKITDRPLIIYDHRQKVDGLAFNHLDQIFALCRDNTIRIWETDMQRMSNKLCTLVNEPMSLEDWQTEVADTSELPYDPIWHGRSECLKSIKQLQSGDQ